MEVNCFQILLIDVTFLSLTCLRVILNVLIKNENPNICGTGGKGLINSQNAELLQISSLLTLSYFSILLYYFH